ncbi:MAG TPA: PepSY domain-containing protein [Vicinamibacterales bacterium]
MPLRRFLIVVHRWLGVALCLFFALWFPSGIGMMYWDFPSVSPADRLNRSPALDPSTVRLSPVEALATLGMPAASEIRLNTFDRRPVYRFRINGADEIVYADTGERHREVSNAMAQRIASAWVAQPAPSATVAILDEADQWTVPPSFGALRPMFRYGWPNGDQVYVSQGSGEVVQFTTSLSRLEAYLGPIPHWLYFTPLRKRPALWNAVVTWVSGIGTIAAVLGLAIGVWTWSPFRRYRVNGTAVRWPYRGAKRWHAILGLIVGVAAATWAFSGMLSMEPFPLRGGGGDESRSTIARALRGQPAPAAFDRFTPSAALTRLAGTPVKELELISLAGDSLYIAHVAGGETRVVTLDGQLRAAFDQLRIGTLVTKALAPSGRASTQPLERYDRYYLDRRHQRPLPVLLVTLDDRDQSRYYLDLKTATIVEQYGSRDWISRWLYHGLHSLDFPWLYDHRPLWDIVVIALMLGGTALSVTSMVLAWQVLGRTLARIAS